MENFDIYQFIVALGALIGTVTGVWSLIQQKRKTEAEADKEEATAADIIQGASKELIEQYKVRVTELSQENKELQDEIMQLKADIEILKTKVIELEQKLLAVSKENKENIEALQKLLDERIQETRFNVTQIQALKNEIALLQEKIKQISERNGG